MLEWANQLLEKLAAAKEGSGVVGKLSKLGYFVFGATGIGLRNISGASPQVADRMLIAIGLVAGAYLLFAVGALVFAALNPLAANMVSADHVKALNRQLQQLQEVARRGQQASAPTANVPAPPAEVIEVAPPGTEQTAAVREPAQ
jgi:hypothetical protein